MATSQHHPSCQTSASSLFFAFNLLEGTLTLHILLYLLSIVQHNKMMNEDIPLDIDTGSTSRGTTTGRETEEHGSEQSVRDAFIRKEERNVLRAKIVVTGAIVVCAAAVTASVYIFAKQNDQHSFEVEVSTHKYARAT